MRRNVSTTRATSRARGPAVATAFAVLAVVVLLVGGLVVDSTPPALAAGPAQVTLDGDWELVRTNLGTCTIAVPPVIGGPIHIEADFVEGTISGRIQGSGSGDHTLSGGYACGYDEPETWYGEMGVIDGTFSGPLDRVTGAFELEFVFYTEAWAVREVPGLECSIAGWGERCPLPEINPDQWAIISGTILPEGRVVGDIDFYTFQEVYCATMSNKQSAGKVEVLTSWGDGCPTLGSWGVDVTNTVWKANAAPEVGAISASPADPTSDDTVMLSVNATDPDDDDLNYSWYIDGDRSGASAPSVTWDKPQPGDHVIKVTVSDGGDTTDAFLDIRVSEHVGAGDRDDDGVPDDEDSCPTEWGTGDDGCPPFAATIGCIPVRPLPKDTVVCTAKASGVRVDETLAYNWYLDGGNVQSGVSAAWTWGSAESGIHDIGVQAIGEGRSSDADVTLEVGGGLVDAVTAGFHIVSVTCNSGVSSDDTLQCSVTFERDRDHIGPLSVTWLIAHAPATSHVTSGNNSTWVLAQPAPGDHTVSVALTDPATNYTVGGVTSAHVTPGRNAMVPPALQAGAAAATTLTAGGWLWLEWARRRREEAWAADAEAALAADRRRWYGRVMDLNSEERARRAAYAAAVQAQQDAVRDQWKQLVDSLDRSVDEGARLRAIRDFVGRHEGETFKDGVWNAAAVARIQDKVQRLGLLQSDRDFYQSMVDFREHVGPVMNSAFELSRSTTVRIGSGVLSGGWSEAVWIPLSAGDTAWQAVTDTTKRGRARSAENAVWMGTKGMARDTAALLLWGKVFKDGARAFSPELQAVKGYLSRRAVSSQIAVGVRQAWERVPASTRARIATYADDTWASLTKQRHLVANKPQLPVIRHGWGRPVTYMSRDGITSWNAARPGFQGAARVTPWVERLDRLRAVGLEDDVVQVMTGATGEGLDLGSVSSVRFGTGQGQPRLSSSVVDPATGVATDGLRLNVSLTAHEETALRVMQHPRYRELLNDGVIPRPFHAAAVHARDRYVKLQVAAAVERLSPAARDNLVRIDFTGTGARPHSAAATSTRFTDLDLTPRGTADEAGRAAERAFCREFDRGMRGDPIWGDGGFNTATADVNAFAGLHESATGPRAAYRSSHLVYWQEADTTYRARSGILTKNGIAFDASPDARPMPGQGPLQMPHQPPISGPAAARDAGRVIGNHIDDMTGQLGRPPRRLDVLIAEGKNVRRVWWANNRGTGRIAPPGIHHLDDLKAHPGVPQTREAADATWQIFEETFGEHTDLRGIQ